LVLVPASMVLTPLSGLVQLLVDGCHLFHPAAPFRVLHRKHRLSRPVEVVGEIGYLLVDSFEGVAIDPPRLAISTSTSVEHSGHCAVMIDVPRSLIWR
jgi:hypothetical protein